MLGQTGAGSIAHSLNRGATYRIDPQRRLIVITYVGAISFDDIRRIQTLAKQDRAFDPLFSVLLDGSHADLSAITDDDLMSIAMNTPMDLTARRAFVVNSAVNRGMAQQFYSLSELRGRSFPFALFDNLEAAIRWIATPASAAAD